MKRIFIILIICIFMFISCGNNNKPQEKINNDNQSKNSDQQLIVSKLALGEARNKTAQELKEIFDAAGVYYLDNAEFPIGKYGDFLKAYYQAYPDAEKLPEKDPWGNPYIYASTDGQSVILSSAGPDGELGGKDDDDIFIIDGELKVGSKLKDINKPAKESDKKLSTSKSTKKSDKKVDVKKSDLIEARNKTLEDMTKITEAAMRYFVEKDSFPIGKYNDFLKAYYQAYPDAEKLPEKDAWGNPILYSSKSGKNLFLASAGPDGVFEGTEDDDILIVNGELTIGKKLRIK